jgi:demethoxyubiquinone hydroxylase (CLK1/Coq7/Cat5 family)
MQPNTDQAVNTLNSFLRGEMSAVETYRQALDKVDEPPVRATLQECLESHQKRVGLIASRIQNLGGKPSTESGVWGFFAKLVEGGAKLMGTKPAVAALEQGEDHGRDDYKRDIDQLDMTSRQLIETEVLPEQERTHRALSRLKHNM